MAKKNTVTYIGTGRRKTSVARVFMTPGTGNISVNGKTLEEYLPLETLRMVVKSPLELTETLTQFDVKINVHGGGYTGQTGAIRLGIARALLEYDADNAGVDTKCNVYKSKFLDCKRVPNRSHVYIDRECATLIKNVLPIIAPDASISGFVSNIVADHLEKYKPEIIKMYNDRISKIM